MRATVNRGLFQPGDFEQIGHVMEAGRFWNVRTIHELNAPVMVSEVRRERDFSSISLTYQQDGGQHVATIKRLGGGEIHILTCDYCHRPQDGGRVWVDTQTTHCSHIRWLVRKGRDSAFLEDGSVDDHTFMVPIAPSEGVYHPVWITKDRRRGRYGITVPRREIDGSEGNYRHLATLDQGGVTVTLMRSLLIDHFYGHFGDVRHYYQESQTEPLAPSAREFADDVDGKLSVFTRRFAIATTGMTFGEFEAKSRPNPDAPSWN